MALTTAERQERFRKGQAVRIERMRSALEAIVLKLDGNEKPLAVELRALAEAGLLID